MRELTVAVQGASIFVREAGEGPPVLLLHGNPDSADMWDGVLPLLSREHRCLAPDLPGFGRSQVPAGFDFRLASMASFVDGLVAALGVAEPLRLVVHDFGGPYGLAWAVEQPRRVSHVAVFNSLFSTRLRWHFWARIWRTPLLGELSMGLMSRWLFARELRRGSHGRLSREHVDRAWSHVGPRVKRMVLRLYRATDPQCFGGWEERLRELASRVPVKVFWGRRDPYLSLDLADAFGTDDVELFDDGGHWLPAESPEEVAPRLLDFFRRSGSA